MSGHLPVTQHKAALMNKVDSNRVTIVIGATGCGKSTQLPQMLFMHLRKRVLCVQPRRMAVVAVATRVSQELGEPLGEGTVGYHIGAAKVAELDNTQLMFVTAGIFLQTLKSDGAAALEQYGAVIVDEVHERSCENDLALACLMQLAIHAKELRALRIVLMSATADVRRYREFVRQLCDDHAGKPGEYAIGESAKVYNTSSRYLRDALTEAESSLPLESFEKQDHATLHQICVLLSSLVPALVRRTIREDGPGCTILVFLATYASIEQTYARLDDLRFAGIPIYVLHSCMDMDDCMAALLGEDGAPARVVLASSVAESSITIKRVTHVIDSCRSCEIHWTPMTGQSSAHIVWASQAQMQQRAGRTGRTNNGTVWKLITPIMCRALPEYEVATLQLQLLRKEVLLLSCADSKHIKDYRKLLSSCLDSPKEEVITRAEEWLLENHMIAGESCETSYTTHRKQVRAPMLRPTALGRLLDAMPVDLDSSRTILLGGLVGLLEEAVVMAVLRSNQPMPLKREPNQQAKYEKLIKRYGPVHAELDAFKEDELLANVASYLSFQRWKGDPRRLRRIRRSEGLLLPELEGEVVRLSGLQNRPELNGELVFIIKYDSLRRRYAVQLQSGESILVQRVKLVEAEVEWCRERSLSHASLLAASRSVEHVLQTLFHYFPPLLQRNLSIRQSRPPPTLSVWEGSVPASGQSIFPLLLPRRTEMLLRKLAQTFRPPQDRHASTAQHLSDVKGPCFFFRRGCCSAHSCPYLHQNSADSRPVCKFALSGICKYGNSCRYRHPAVAPPIEQDPEVTDLQSMVQRGLGSAMPLFSKVDEVSIISTGEDANVSPPPEFLNFDSVLLVGEGDFTFAAWLASTSALQQKLTALRPTRIVASSVQSQSDVLRSHPAHAERALTQLQALGATIMHGIDARQLDQFEELSAPPDCIVWNLPFAHDIEAGKSVKSEPNQVLLHGFFASVIRWIELWRDKPGIATAPKIFVTVGIHQFADWNLLSVSHECFLDLHSVHKFDPSMIGNYSCRRNERDETFDIGEMCTFCFSVSIGRLNAASKALEMEPTPFARGCMT